MVLGSSWLDLDDHPFRSCGLVTFGIQFCGFLFAYWLQTETFYDVLGSGNFLLLALWTYSSSSSSSSSTSKCLIGTALFCASRAWLLIFLAWRAHDRKGDTRFDGVKEKAPLFLLYWMVQGIWVFLVSLSIIHINTAAATTTEVVATTSFQEKLWMAMFALAIGLEIVADVQKTWWIKGGRTGGFCSFGIWKWSRHPNYFAEILQWWSCYFMAFSGSSSSSGGFGSSSSSSSWVCLLSPLFTMWILLFAGGTGLVNAEGQGLARYYKNKEYAKPYGDYRAQTSILVPLPNALYSALPLWVKRIVLFEWERYEYKETKLQ